MPVAVLQAHAFPQRWSVTLLNTSFVRLLRYLVMLLFQMVLKLCDTSDPGQTPVRLKPMTASLKTAEHPLQKPCP